MSSEVNKQYTRADTHPHYFGTITKMGCHLNIVLEQLKNEMLYLFLVTTIKRHGHVTK
jgi:hypothetical protein